MDEKVREIINKIYFAKKYDYFIEKSRNKIELPSTLIKYLEDLKFKVEEEDDIMDIEKVFYIKFKNIHKNDFNASFFCKLKFSKLIHVYNIEYYFEIENVDSDRIEPTLGGFLGNPYNKSQLEFDQQVSEILDHNGYLRLYYRDMEEVVEGLKMPERVTLFGPQVTVETALFRDVFELVPDEES